MSGVLDFADVSVRRGGNLLLERVDWSVSEDERWVILGPNGAGKTTLLQLAAAQMQPTSGVAAVLGEELGDVDVFDLRPGSGSPVPPSRTGSRGMSWSGTRSCPRRTAWSGAGARTTSRSTTTAPTSCCARSASGPGGPDLRDPQRGRAQARADRPVPDGRPRAAVAGRARRRPRSRRREDLVHILSILANFDQAPVIVMVSHHVEEIPPGFTHALLMREGKVVASGPIDDVITEPLLSETFGMPLVVTRTAGRYTARRRTAATSADYSAGRATVQYMDWLGEHLWATWLGLAILLGVLELFSLDMVLLMLASGALAGSLTAAVGLPLPVQVIVAALASMAMLTTVRPSVIKRLHTGPELRLGHGKLVGRQGVVTETITARSKAGSSSAARSGLQRRTTTTTPSPRGDRRGLRDPRRHRVRPPDSAWTPERERHAIIFAVLALVMIFVVVVLAKTSASFSRPAPEWSSASASTRRRPCGPQHRGPLHRQGRT